MGLSNVKAKSTCALAALLMLACGKKSVAPTADEDAAASVAETTSGPVADAAVAVQDDAGAPSGPRVYAIVSPAPIFNITEWPAHDPSKTSEDRKAAMLVGYLRKGDSAVYKTGPTKKGNCPEGWYELAVGGFICGKSVTTNPNDPALADAPHAPFPQGPLPYDYGLNITNGAPLYVQIPSGDEEEKFEKGLNWDRGKKAGDADDAQGGSGDTPWYLQQQGGKPTVKFSDLRGDGFPVQERMVRGFYVSLDKDVPGRARLQRQRHEKFWRTVRGLYVREDHIMVHDVKVEFQGINLAAPGETRHLPLAFVLGFHTHPQKINADGSVHHSSEHIDRFSIVQLTGKKQSINFHDFYETADGSWLRDLDVTITKPLPPPADLKPGEKWIDVDLAHQTLVAFEGDKPVYATMISSGKHNEDPEKNHRTPSGDFRIREKHVSATMDDDGASDGTYSIEDVPWIMYFHGGYALHGAFWHSAWGHERSHGCINMTPTDARVIFGWVGPTLPDGWHGVHQTDANPGTRVIVHDEVWDKEKAERAKAKAAGAADAGE
jgi:hypothetical protein